MVVIGWEGERWACVKVLIVDDSDETRQRLARLLERVGGIEVVGSASCGRAAVCQDQRLNPDAVVLDLQMPDGNGFYALNELKTAHPNRLVIVLTNYADPPFERRCRAAGADYFFDKSRDFEKVADVLHHHIV